MAFILQSKLNQIQFLLREKWLGRLTLRRGLPKPQESQAESGERAFYRLVLDRALPLEERDRIEVAWDIGCRNWSYASAIAQSFARARLIGVEVDGKRRYWNLFRREDVARSYALQLEQEGRGAECIFRDFRLIAPDLSPAPQSRHVFCFFFPFVSERPCVKWGLPRQYADFASLLSHALRLAHEPILISIHQGEWEAEIARAAYARVGVAVREQLLEPREFVGLWPARYTIHLFVSGSVQH